MISPLSGRQWLFVLLSFILCWPVLLNRGPILFSDTTSYIRSADALVYTATGQRSAWSDVITAAPAPRAALHPGSAAVSSFNKNILVGRSIGYGMFLYLGVLLGSLVVPAVLQALLAGVAIVGGARHFADPQRDRARFGWTVGTAFVVVALGALPYFSGFLMPDLFAGLALLAATIVLCGWARETRRWRLFWVALLCCAALVHSSHIVLLGALGCVAALLQVRRAAGIRWVPVAVIFGAALVGLAGDLAFTQGISAVAHRHALRPPFVAMRLIADGPGTAYLHATCPASGYALCAARVAPQASSDVLLWSADPALGLFTARDAVQQRRIADEQLGFVLAVAWRYPGWTAQTALRNLAVQLGAVGLAEFTQPVLADPGVAARIPPSLRAHIAASPAEHGALPTRLYRSTIWPVTLVALGILGAASWRSGWRSATPALLIGAGIVLNAAVCGMLSTPTDRYQDRVIWVIALVAVYVASDALRVAPPRRIRA